MIRPRGNLVLVRKLPSEDRVTEGGICLPISAQEAFIKAKVVAAGPGQWLECGQRAGLDLAVGDVVLIRNDVIDRRTGQVNCRLVPVSSDSKLCLVGDQDIFAVETPEIASC